ncbi:hypothetical protein CERSUDRAFT_94724 [Gelatoporia subvermispora B]|uniref:RRM domain-containing protein n=1 Tax=Ceriporiopsis subvermispora (strain B) TaxID=914234 RepID=M2QZQ6_CERS8|nr:hypothetical protein CERSUDRAFT_94724 [Gelatoporia subvermispora B]
MGHHPVPFPTLSHQPDEITESERAIPPRLHSTPSLPNLWLPPHCAPLPSHLEHQSQARYRPRLRPLDLASSPNTSPTKSKGMPSARGSISGSPCRPSAMLTPPLTPSSSFASNDAPSTPPEAHSPLRWVHTAESPYSATELRLSPTHLKGPPLPRGGFLTPSSGRSQSMSSENEWKYMSPGFNGGSDGLSALVTGISSIDLTPRDEKNLANDMIATSQLLSDTACQTDVPSRFVFIRNVPITASSATLRTAFEPCGDIKGMLPRFLADHGVVILAFYDLRQAVRARKIICEQTLAGLEGARLDAKFMLPEKLESIMGRSAFVADTDGVLTVSVENGRLDPSSLRNIFSSVGELMSFTAMGTDPHDQTFRVEYYDVRCAQSALKSFNRCILGARLRVCSRLEADSLTGMQADSTDDDPFLVPTGIQGGTSAPYRAPVPLPAPESLYPTSRGQQADESARESQGRVRPRSVSASESVGTPDAVRKLRRGRDSPQEHSRRSSNHLFFDAVGKSFVQPKTPSRPRSISIGPEGMAGTANVQRPDNAPYVVPAYPYPAAPYAYDASGVAVPPYAPQGYAYGQPVYFADSDPYMGHGVANMNHQWVYAPPPTPGADYHLPSPTRPAPYQHPPPHALPPTPCKSLPPIHTRHLPTQYPPTRSADPTAYSPPTTASSPSLHLSSSADKLAGASGQTLTEKNQLNIAAIEEGKDMRTTVMIKNIPNKMSDRDLLAFIERVCPRRIDFMYLRMDFQNGCNVGYAFVNFITVGDLLHFAKTQLGVKWNMYSSEKVLQMCYATYQGKEALVEKFKNSCIMDEREAWRPKIFYSDGSNQGLPEPFPPPTHLRRKERSSHNRGALFVPGPHYVHQRESRGAGAGGSNMYHSKPQAPRFAH